MRVRPALCDALNMATTQEIKLFGKWTFDDVEVSLLASRARRDASRVERVTSRREIGPRAY